MPIQVTLSLYLLYSQVQVAFVAGLAVVLLLVPVNRWLALKIGSLSETLMTHKDGRISATSEAVTAIRVVKFFAWEGLMSDRIQRHRTEEVAILARRKYIDAWCVYFWATTPVLISLVTFTTYALSGNALTSSTVFTCMSLFNMLISPLNAFPWVIMGVVEAVVSLYRVEAFLGEEDRDLSVFKPLEQSTPALLTFNNVTWSWGRSATAKDDAGEEAPPTRVLHNVSLSIEPGTFTILVGSVGGGKRFAAYDNFYSYFIFFCTARF